MGRFRGCENEPRVSGTAEKAIGYRLVMGCLRMSHYWREKQGVSGEIRVADRLKATLWHFSRLQGANSTEKARGLGLVWDADTTHRH